MSHIAASPQPKEYSPQSHGDTEKSNLKGKTRAHGGGGGHGENPRGAQRFSALVVQRHGEKPLLKTSRLVINRAPRRLVRTPCASVSSATSAPSGFDFDVCFLSVSVSPR